MPDPNSPQPVLIDGLTDTHCHLEMSQFDADREEVIARALSSGVKSMITIASDPGSNQAVLALAQRHHGIYCSVGLHPHDARHYTDEFHASLLQWTQSPKVVAIGEMGLDYHYDHSPREVQREVFARQLSLARELNLPAIIHSREATPDTMSIIKESGIRRGVMHCFSGDINMAREVIGLGLHISVAGPVTFPKSIELKEVAAWIPDDSLLIETDAPFLTPVPFRGKRNEPMHIVHTARAVAQLRGITPEDVARITSLNARRLFGLEDSDSHKEGAIVYPIRDSLYLNLTNRCTNACSFCVRYHSDYVKGHHLKIRHEPTVEELIKAIGDPGKYKEIVFCGYGEPTMRIREVVELAGWIKAHGGMVRINTNGHANIIHGRNVLPELAGKVDSISVSLDAQDPETYNKLCRPRDPEAWQAVIDFIREAKKHIPAVQATVVTAEGVDVAKCQTIADELGVTLRVRTLDIVG